MLTFCSWGSWDNIFPAPKIKLSYQPVIRILHFNHWTQNQLKSKHQVVKKHTWHDDARSLTPGSSPTTNTDHYNTADNTHTDTHPHPLPFLRFKGLWSQNSCGAHLRRHGVVTHYSGGSAGFLVATWTHTKSLWVTLPVWCRGPVIWRWGRWPQISHGQKKNLSLVKAFDVS